MGKFDPPLVLGDSDMQLIKRLIKTKTNEVKSPILPAMTSGGITKLNCKIKVMGQWILIHEKFTLESNVLHFSESQFYFSSKWWNPVHAQLP